MYYITVMIEQLNLQEQVELSILSKNKKTALEIGSYSGSATKILVFNCDLIFSVDWWNGSLGSNTRLSHEEQFPIFYDEFKDKVVIIAGDVADVLPALCKNYFDIIFIDGDHRYSHVNRDIQNAKELVAENGIICGHDYDLGKTEINKSYIVQHSEHDMYSNHHFGVIRAVNENFKNFNVEGTIWSSNGNN